MYSAKNTEASLLNDNKTIELESRSRAIRPASKIPGDWKYQSEETRLAEIHTNTGRFRISLPPFPAPALTFLITAMLLDILTKQ